MGRGRGGIRRWREWLHRATHHSAADDRQLVQAAEQTRREEDEESGLSAGLATAGGPAAQASLDHVLRRAAEARASQHQNLG